MSSLTPIGGIRALRILCVALLGFMASTLVACAGKADPPQPMGGVSPPGIAAPTLTPVASQTVQSGQTATFSEAASGTGPLSYQWHRDGTAISGATSATYTTPATVPSDSGALFTVAVSNSAGSVTSAPATLTVTVPVTLSLTQQPTSVTVASGAPAAFTAAATCSASPITWQWQRSGDGGATWTNVAGATVASFTLTTALGDNGAEFRAQAHCGGLIQATSSATLTVTSAGAGPTLAELTTGLAPAANMDEPAGVVLDGAGIAYVVDSFRNAIRRVGTDGTVVTIAGQSSVNPGSSDGTGSAASFNRPRGIAIGGDGALYITDTQNHTIRRITTAGVVTTVAGTAGSSGAANGTGAAARFNQPFGITVGSDGALYIADGANFTIRRMTLTGAVTTIAGTAGASGIADGTGASARFGFPAGIVGDGAGALYVSDQENNTIRKVTLAGVTTTIAGNGSTTAADGIGTAAGIPRPGGLALSGGSLYLTAFGEASTNGGNLGQVRRLDFSDGSVHTVAGIGSQASAPVEPQVDGDVTHAVFQFGIYQTGASDGVNRAAVAVTAGGTIYVTDPGNGSLRTVTAGVTTSLVSGLVPGPNGDGNTIPSAAFSDLTGIMALAVDPSGFLVVTDAGDCDVRRISQAGATRLAAGLHDRCGAHNGKGSGALFSAPDGIAAAPDGTLYVTDTGNSAIRRIAVDGTVTTFAGVMGSAGSNDGTATVARFYQPAGIVMDAAGILYVADSTGTTIRRIALDGSVTTLAGSATNFGYADGTGAAARFSSIKGLAIDAAGVLYAADDGNLAIRKITSAGVVSTLTGGPSSTGTATEPVLRPWGIAVAANGTVYVADSSDYSVRSVSPTGTVTTVAGSAADNFTRVGSNPRLGSPTGIAILGPKSIAVAASRVYGPGVYGSVYVLTLP